MQYYIKCKLLCFLFIPAFKISQDIKSHVLKCNHKTFYIFPRKIVRFICSYHRHVSTYFNKTNAFLLLCPKEHIDVEIMEKRFFYKSLSKTFDFPGMYLSMD